MEDWAEAWIGDLGLGSATLRPAETWVGDVERERHRLRVNERDRCDKRMNKKRNLE